ncbi:MAG: type II toxin-antitoxin system RelE/ParE family toxin [Enterobacterales bacterium]
MLPQGRVRGPREIDVRPNYVLVCYIDDENNILVVVRVLYAAQQWP